MQYVCAAMTPKEAAITYGRCTPMHDAAMRHAAHCDWPHADITRTPVDLMPHVTGADSIATCAGCGQYASDAMLGKEHVRRGETCGTFV